MEFSYSLLASYSELMHCLLTLHVLHYNTINECHTFLWELFPLCWVCDTPSRSRKQSNQLFPHTSVEAHLFPPRHGKTLYVPTSCEQYLANRSTTSSDNGSWHETQQRNSLSTDIPISPDLSGDTSLGADRYRSQPEVHDWLNHWIILCFFHGITGLPTTETPSGRRVTCNKEKIHL